ncbi:MAG: hypothetical protein WA484_04815 [Solirubrobacteraceae bacterium]
MSNRENCGEGMGFMSLCVRIVRVVVLAGLLGVVLGVLPGTANAESCLNERLRSEQGDRGLPDCRAYEMVSPSDKGATTPLLSEAGGPLTFTAVSGDGSHVWLSALEAFSGPHPGPRGTNAVLARTTEGWTFSSLQPSGSGSNIYYPNIFSSNLTMVGVETRLQKQLFVSSPEHSFLVGPPGGPYSTIATLTNETGNPFAIGNFLAGASEDGSRVVLASTDHTLVPGVSETLSGAHDLYEWDGGGECKPGTSNCKPVNVTSAGSLISTCGAELGRTAKTSATAIGFTTPMSGDGSKIFFTAPDETMESPTNNIESSEPACKEPLRIYMRVDGRETVDISAPQGVTDPTGLHNAYFVGATLDGTHVWFTSETELTKDDEGIHDLELYEYNTVTGTLVRVSRGESGTAKGEIDGVPNEHDIAFAEDGSTLYFKAEGKLTANTPSAIQTPYHNIYRYDTATGVTRYVATTHEVSGNYLPLDASADGKALVFDGQEETTGSTGLVYDESVAQLFRYYTGDQSVTCVSCPPKGTVADGPARSLLGEVLSNETFSNGVIADYEVSREGQYVAFTSNDALLPQDSTEESTEGYGPASDVYEWEARGTGSCVNPEGCLSLISRPDTGHGSKFYGMSTDGRDLIFATDSALVPQDLDTVPDLYDARIGGGFAASSSVPCSGEGCRLVGGAPPTFGAPQSFAFYGAGNPPVAPAAASKPLTRAQKLTRALRACTKKKKRKQRGACERKAHKQYVVKQSRKANGGGR